jgi:hypothetical protein
MEEANVANEVKTNEIEVKLEVAEAKPEVNPIKLEVKQDSKKDINYDDMFIRESDTFDIEVSYYYSNNDLLVDGVDETFDKSNPNVKSFMMTLKYPSQGDFETIMSRVNYKSPESMSILDMYQLEVTRLIVIMRKWSLKKKLIVSELVNMNPKIVKGIINKVRETISTQGLI